MMLEFDNVSFRYPEGARDAVRGVTLRVGMGTIFSLLGPNGSGKSTLLLAALGWIRPRTGEVRVDGRPVQAHSRGELARRVAYLSQIERVSFSFECLEYVLLGRAPHLAPLAEPDRADEEKAYAALELLGHGAFARRHVTALSGGEFQLVRIARCLAQESPLILMDEPTAALDPANTLRVADALRALAASGKTVVFSTHDAALASYASRETALVRDGRLLASGPAGDILTPEHLSGAFDLPFGLSRIPSPFGGR